MNEVPMVSVKELRKVFGESTALHKIDFDVSPGEILAFIGPNGAGKTTTIRILAGLLSPTEGTARIDGIDVAKSPRTTRALVGYMPDFVGFYDNTTVREFLHFFASAHRIPKKERETSVENALALTDLQGKADAEMAHLSRGMSQRASLARSLIHDPKLLLLDEPASGLDPRGRIEMRALLRELSDLGKTILISSHILTELEELCTQVVILESGRIAASGTPREVRDGLHDSDPRNRDRDLEVTFRLQIVDRPTDALLRLREIPAVHEVEEVDERTFEGLYRGTPEEASEIVDTMVREGFRVMTFVEKEVDLEEVFLRVTKGDLN